MRIFWARGQHEIFEVDWKMPVVMWTHSFYDRSGFLNPISEINLCWFVDLFTYTSLPITRETGRYEKLIQPLSVFQRQCPC